MLDTQPQERGTQQNTVRARRKPIRSSPPFGTYNRWRLEYLQDSDEPGHIKPALT